MVSMASVGAGEKSEDSIFLGYGGANMSATKFIFKSDSDFASSLEDMSPEELQGALQWIQQGWVSASQQKLISDAALKKGVSSTSSTGSDGSEIF